MPEITLGGVNQKLAEKQKKLSEAETFESTLEEDFDNAENKLDCKEAELRLKFETIAEERISDKKIWVRVVSNEEYQVAKAEYILAKSALKKCKIEIKVLHKEMHTLESMAKNIAMEIKYQLR